MGNATLSAENVFPRRIRSGKMKFLQDVNMPQLTVPGNSRKFFGFLKKFVKISLDLQKTELRLNFPKNFDLGAA